MSILVLLFGIISYVIGIGGLTYFILYIGAWEFLPIHINSGEAGSVVSAVVINLGLMVLFGLQHTVTARPKFKAAITKVLPVAAERSSYVLLSGIMMFLICLYWQPVEGIVWQAASSWLQTTLIGLYVLGWVICVGSSFLINHFELFGLQQVYLNLRPSTAARDTFTERGLYRLVRHPIQLGVLIGIWFTPTMTMTHLMLAVTMTIYIFIGLYFEEKDLMNGLGSEYEDYRRRVRKLLPLPVRKSGREKPLVI
ncbi:MAG: isoprenylcysteine carboxylmethyltransferase family protein [Gammaproteobacteria bacterium]|jgi:methanethiol S-methyltransferase|nr:isoprenylcysteine carboxylmethyltransferase family protein [Gammaproteobacteria bacterium]MBT4493589.1 isoprenylcysteine carboxylmethyltransferase family protein [Gammaproteobacteria bacterium]MBT7371106.1 isoprenylcysteine carboxylmethyltransferase family protein [Gammaproteobacteria bacterium]